MPKTPTLEELLKSSISLKSVSDTKRQKLLSSLETITREEKDRLHNILLTEYYEYEDLKNKAQLQIINKYLEQMLSILKETNKALRVEAETEEQTQSTQRQAALLKELDQI